MGPQCVLVHGRIPPQREGLAFSFVESYEVFVSPSLQPVKVPLNGSTTNWSINPSSLLCILCKLCPTVQVIGEDTKPCWIQYQTLDYFTSDWPANWPACLSAAEQLSFQSTLLSIYLVHISSDCLWDLTGDSFKRLS